MRAKPADVITGGWTSRANQVLSDVEGVESPKRNVENCQLHPLIFAKCGKGY